MDKLTSKIISDQLKKIDFDLMIILFSDDIGAAEKV